MLGITSGSELLSNRRNRTIRKKEIPCELDSVQLPFNENCMKISIKKISSRFIMKLPEIIRTSTFSELENSETEVSNFLKKLRFNL